jgi:hypothetical protein
LLDEITSTGSRVLVDVANGALRIETKAPATST